jgi:hypothetical protein
VYWYGAFEDPSLWKLPNFPEKLMKAIDENK